MQTEKAKSSHFDRSRGDKNQIFRTLIWTNDYQQKSPKHKCQLTICTFQ